MDWLADHPRAVLLAVLLLAISSCSVFAAEDPGQKFSDDVLYCQNFGKWGETFQLYINLKADAQAAIDDIFHKIGDQVASGQLEPEDAVVLILGLYDISDTGGYGIKKRKQEFYSACMTWRGHKKKKLKPGEVET